MQRNLFAKTFFQSQSAIFLSRLIEAGVDVRFADLQQIDGATGRFMLQEMVVVAELEAGVISTRTKAALAAKARGKSLGGRRIRKPERIVIIEFPVREKAEAFLSDPENQGLFKVRHETTTSKLVLADGCT